MSVINRMLQDLEARGVSPALAPPSTGAPADAPLSTAKRAAAPSEPEHAHVSALFSRSRQQARWHRMVWTGLAVGVVAALFMGTDYGRLLGRVKAMAPTAPVAASLPPHAAAISPPAPQGADPVKAQQTAAAAAAVPAFVMASTLQGDRLVRAERIRTMRLSRAAHALNTAMQQPAAESAVVPAPQGSPATAAALPTSASRLPSPAKPVAQAVLPPGLGATSVGPSRSIAARAANTYQKAQDLVDEGREDQALSAALEALRLDPHLAAARHLAVTLYLEGAQPQLAAALIDEGLQQDPQDGQLIYLRARYQLACGQNEQALQTLQKHERLTSEGWGLKAALLARGGLNVQAVTAYEQALRARPDNATWWMGLGVALEAQGQNVTAREAYDHARTLGTLRPDLQSWLNQKLANSN